MNGKKYDGIMVDIWSTGIILYAMLCGFLPFDDEDIQNIYIKILKCDVEYPDNLTDDAIDLIKKILVLNPEKRITIEDIDKVIAALLLDKKLMRDNESMNRLLANENGVKKDIRYKLLQLDNPLSKFKKENSNKIITNSNKSSYSNIDVLNNKNKSKEKKVKRIEDKLLDYGKALKQKKAQERVDKLKAEDEQCTFKPNLKKKNFIKSFSNTDFYTRAAKFEEKKEKDLSTLKSKISDRDKNKNEYTFKPKISKNSKKIKRSIDDLYNWNKEKQRKIEEKQINK